MLLMAVLLSWWLEYQQHHHKVQVLFREVEVRRPTPPSLVFNQFQSSLAWDFTCSRLSLFHTSPGPVHATSSTSIFPTIPTPYRPPTSQPSDAYFLSIWRLVTSGCYSHRARQEAGSLRWISPAVLCRPFLKPYQEGPIVRASAVM